MNQINRLYYLGFMILGFSLYACAAPALETVPTNDAQSQIFAAAKFSADKCGTRIPEPALLVFNPPPKRNLELCTVSITRVGCPFTAYPLPCLLIYLNENAGNIPWYLNFNELSKQQIK